MISKMLTNGEALAPDTTDDNLILRTKGLGRKRESQFMKPAKTTCMCSKTGLSACWISVSFQRKEIPNLMMSGQIGHFFLAWRHNAHMMIFGYSEAVNTEDFCSQHWNKENPYEPSLHFHENPLALIWLITSAKLGHPWATLDHDPASEASAEDLELTNLEKKVRRPRKHATSQPIRIKVPSNQAQAQTPETPRTLGILTLMSSR